MGSLMYYVPQYAGMKSHIINIDKSDLTTLCGIDTTKISLGYKLCSKAKYICKNCLRVRNKKENK